MRDFREKTGHGEKLSRRQEDAIAALLSAPTIMEAAKQVGVAASTMYRWLQDPSFKKLYAAAKRGVLESATSRLRSHCADAVDVLAAVAMDPKAPAHARVSAAGRIIESALRAHEVEDVEARLQEIEKQTEETGRK